MPNKKPVQPSEVPVVKVQTPVIKPTPMPGGTAALMKIQNSVDRKKKR
jgi:hypothetical protein